jgi:molybdate transport system substrate-binding protein
MKNSIMLAAAGFAATMLLSQAGVVNAAEIKVMSANGLQEVMENLGPKFERVSGHKLAITFATLGVVVKRVQDGETADVVIIPREGINNFVKDGNVAAGNVTVIAHGEIAVAVRKGAPKPDIWSLEALKRTLLAAKSITYIDPALGSESGIHVADQIERLGIANEMKAKTVLAKTAKDVGILVANGTAEIGVAQFQVLVSIAGIELVGPLSVELQETLVFSAAIMAGAKNAEAAKALVNFLHTPEAAAVIREKGMHPGTDSIKIAVRTENEEAPTETTLLSRWLHCLDRACGEAW